MARTLRPEPYNPDAVDADNDGIVQEGTAFERPAGTRLLNRAGQALQRGMESVIPVEGVQDAYANNWGGQEVSIAAMTGANITSQLKLGGKGLDEQGVLDAIVSKVTGGASSTALAAGNFASDVVTETATGWDRGNLGQSIENITGNMSRMIDK